MFDICSLYRKLNLSTLGSCTKNLDQSVYQGHLLIAASTNEKFIGVSDCKGISVILMVSEWLVIRINTFWEKHKLCPTA